MAKQTERNWLRNFLELKEYISVHGHLPDKHKVENRGLLSWAKYQRKKIKEGSLDPERQRLFEELMSARSTEHTGGRKRKPLADTGETPETASGC